MIKLSKGNSNNAIETLPGVGKFYVKYNILFRQISKEKKVSLQFY